MSWWGIVIDLNRLSAYPSAKSAGTNEGAGHSVFPRGDKEADDSFFAECLGGLQTMQTLNQHKARALRPHQDRCLLAVVQHIGGDFVHALLFERGAPFYRT